MTNMSLDEDLIVLENHDFDVTCNGRDDCNQKADWSVDKTCCPRQFFFCDPHREYLMKCATGQYRCTDCGTKTNNIRALFTNWVRL